MLQLTCLSPGDGRLYLCVYLCVLMVRFGQVVAADILSCSGGGRGGNKRLLVPCTEDICCDEQLHRSRSRAVYTPIICSRAELELFVHSPALQCNEIFERDSLITKQLSNLYRSHCPSFPCSLSAYKPLTALCRATPRLFFPHTSAVIPVGIESDRSQLQNSSVVSNSN